jgi:hypothetical protein
MVHMATPVHDDVPTRPTPPPRRHRQPLRQRSCRHPRRLIASARLWLLPRRAVLADDPTSDQSPHSPQPASPSVAPGTVMCSGGSPAPPPRRLPPTAPYLRSSKRIATIATCAHSAPPSPGPTSTPAAPRRLRRKVGVAFQIQTTCLTHQREASSASPSAGPREGQDDPPDDPPLAQADPRRAAAPSGPSNACAGGPADDLLPAARGHRLLAHAADCPPLRPRGRRAHPPIPDSPLKAMLQTSRKPSRPADIDDHPPAYLRWAILRSGPSGLPRVSPWFKPPVIRLR